MNYYSQTRKQTSLITSIRFWALTLILILVYTAFIFGQNTIYIDPTNSGDPGQNGTYDHPYDSWNDVAFQNNFTYLQKCGTTYNLPNRIEIVSKHGVKLGSYGTGAKPVIHRPANTIGTIIYINSSRDIIV